MACRVPSQRLALLITPLGSDALLRCPLHLNRAEFPFLDGIQIAPNSRSLVDSLCTTAATAEPDAAHEGFVAVLGTMVALLELFVGERLSFRLLRELWLAESLPGHALP